MIYTHALAAILAGAIAFAGGWQIQGWRLGEQIAATQAAQSAALTAAVNGARTQEAARFSKVQEAQNAAAKRAQVAQADAASARTELDRLRNTITAAAGCLPGDSPAACSQRTDATRLVLAECAGALVEMAGHADGQASTVKLLQDAWPK
jgi:hypothetical protein